MRAKTINWVIGLVGNCLSPYMSDNSKYTKIFQQTACASLAAVKVAVRYSMFKFGPYSLRQWPQKDVLENAPLAFNALAFMLNKPNSKGLCNGTLYGVLILLLA